MLSNLDTVLAKKNKQTNKTKQSLAKGRGFSNPVPCAHCRRNVYRNGNVYTMYTNSLPRLLAYQLLLDFVLMPWARCYLGRKELPGTAGRNSSASRRFPPAPCGRRPGRCWGTACGAVPEAAVARARRR